MAGPGDGRTVMLTLGRLPKALDIARALKGAGCRVVIAEPFGIHLSSPSRAVDRCRRVTAPRTDPERYLADLLQVAAEEGASLVIPVSEEALHAAGLKALAPPGLEVYGPGLATLRRLHDKLAFNRTAAAMGLGVPESHALGTPEAEALVTRSDVVVKDILSSAGIGVRFVERGGALPQPGARAALVQARLPGRHRSTFSIAHEGRVLATVCYEGTVFSHTVAVAFRRIEADDLTAWVDAFVAAEGYSGFIAFDFIDDEDGRAIAIECNPRANSGLHFLEPDWLAGALLAPGTAGPARFRKARLMQQFYPALTETQASVFRPEARRTNWHYLRRSKDVTWRAGDPLPFLLMTFTSWAILKRAMFGGVSFGEAAVEDIAWTG